MMIPSTSSSTAATKSSSLLVRVAVVALSISATDGLSATVTERASLSASRLKEALYSPSGKLTLSPELVIPEPSDPTALLLQASYVKKLSTDLREKAKANAAFVSGSLESVRSVAAEQEDARGGFPGPLPVVLCSPPSAAPPDAELLAKAAEAGACAVSYGDGVAVSDPAELGGDRLNWMADALAAGVCPVPEVTLDPARAWTEADVGTIVALLRDACGGDTDAPACVVLNVDVGGDDDDADADDAAWENVPKISKAFVRQTPVLGSVRTSDREGLRADNDRFKAKGFAGALLRADCVPGFRLNPDLEFVAGFWTAVVADLKSTRSKAFNGFRTKTSLDRDVPAEWLKYQQDVMSSGALGESSTQSNLDDLDLERGDHYGF